MKITINGQSKELNDRSSLHEIITQFSKDCSRVIAEVNGEIVKSPVWPSTTIKDGDTIELVTFVGGG